MFSQLLIYYHVVSPFLPLFTTMSHYELFIPHLSIVFQGKVITFQVGFYLLVTRFREVKTQFVVAGVIMALYIVY